MLIAYQCISELEQMLQDNMSLLAQQRQSYPPFLFWSGADSMWHYLYLSQPEKKIHARIRYCFSQVAQKYHFFDYLAINENHVLAQINPHSRSWNPDLIGADITQRIPIGQSKNGLLLTWDDGRLKEIEVFNCDYGLGPDGEEIDFRRIELQTGLELPRQIDMVQKAKEILDLSGYREFFQILVEQTPCKFCRQTLSAHDKTSDHSYEPFLIYQNFNTFCKVCGISMVDHDDSDHNFDPDFSASQPFIYLPRYFSNY